MDATPDEPFSGSAQRLSATQASARLREAMAVHQQYAYFDHAAVGPLPQKSAEAIAHYASVASQCGDARWLDWAAKIDQLRNSAAQLIHASADEIALVGNTTQGIHLVAQGFPWEPGDNVIVPENEFPSNFLPWKSLERAGVEVRRAPVASRGGVAAIDLNRLETAIDKRTRVLAISWVGYSSGYRIDVSEVVAMAHARGVLVLLDAIQGLGAFPLNVRACDVDFLAADGHKWMLGPEGAGLFYLKREHLSLLHPVGAGWNSLGRNAFEPSSEELKITAARYEGGAWNMPGLQGLGASLNVLLAAQSEAEHGPLAEAILQNVTYLERRLADENFACFLPEPAHRSGILGIDLTRGSAGLLAKTADQHAAADVAASEAVHADARRHLLRADIVTSVRGGRLRISTHAYNNREELDRLVDALVDFRKS